MAGDKMQTDGAAPNDLPAEAAAVAAAEAAAGATTPRSWRRRIGMGLTLLVVSTGLWFADLLPEQLGQSPFGAARTKASNEKPLPKSQALLALTDTQWAALTTETVGEKSFRSTLVTDGKLALNEDLSTPVFSPYAGRILKLMHKPGDVVQPGAPLFVIEAADMVQGQNDYLAAKANLNKAKSQVLVADIVLKRHRDLVAGNAIARRELEQAEIGQIAAANDLKSAEAAFVAARNRLRILGKSDAQITAFDAGEAAMSGETVVNAPIGGTVVQRKVGPGQFMGAASSDPAFVIGDLSSVWVIANLRESDATRVKLGQRLEFTLLAMPGKVFSTTVSYVAATVNPDTRRLAIRAEVANPEGLLRPEMFATVTLETEAPKAGPGVPRNAVIFEGDATRVWVVRPDRSLESRPIKLGAAADGFVEVVSGLAVGESIVTQGSLFIDRIVGSVQ